MGGLLFAHKEEYSQLTKVWQGGIRFAIIIIKLNIMSQNTPTLKICSKTWPSCLHKINATAEHAEHADKSG